MRESWIGNLIEQGHYLGVAVLMLAENVFPPIPSEIVMPVAGVVAERGDMALIPVIIAGTAGALTGQLAWYWLGRRIGKEGLKRFTRRHGRWLTLSPQDIDRADAWFDKHGAKAVLIGRLVPSVRTFISLPAGLSGMPLANFLTYSAIGTAGWTTLLACIGYALGERHENVTRWVGPVSTSVLIAIAAWYVYRVVTFRTQQT